MKDEERLELIWSDDVSAVRTWEGGTVMNSWMDGVPMTPAEVLEVWFSVKDKWTIRYARESDRPYEVFQYFGGGLIDGEHEKRVGQFLTEDGARLFAKQKELEARASMVLWRLSIILDKQRRPPRLKISRSQGNQS